MFSIRSIKGVVAPSTAARVTSRNCSGVSPKLQVSVLLLASIPAATLHGLALAEVSPNASALTLSAGEISAAGRRINAALKYPCMVSPVLKLSHCH